MKTPRSSGDTSIGRRVERFVEKATWSGNVDRGGSLAGGEKEHGKRKRLRL